MAHNETTKSKESLAGKLRIYFITGILVVAPSVITIYVLWKLFKGLDRFLGDHLPYGWIPGTGLLAVICIILFAGMLTRNYVGRKLLELWEALLARIPVMSRFYLAVKQIGEAVFSSKSKAFRSVVLIQYPRKGIYSLAFVTSVPTYELREKLGEGMVSVFVPTTPNPTSGFFLVVPLKEVMPLSMSVEDGLKLVISGGTVQPPGSPLTESPPPAGDQTREG